MARRHKYTKVVGHFITAVCDEAEALTGNSIKEDEQQQGIDDYEST
jgi:hypothetical protein